MQIPGQILKDELRRFLCRRVHLAGLIGADAHQIGAFQGIFSFCRGSRTGLAVVAVNRL